MNDQDLLCIQSQALSRLAEAYVKSKDSAKVRPVLIKFTALAIMDFKASDKESQKELLKQVRASLDFVDSNIEETLKEVQSQPTRIHWQPKLMKRRNNGRNYQHN